MRIRSEVSDRQKTEAMEIRNSVATFARPNILLEISEEIEHSEFYCKYCDIW